ncbi:MAG: helix-turn-helix domain-containing protein [Ruminococcaceae bacterium]|nr:helix-turn-helix domain-containing protein [Oscillospiraceae bacterium]
MYSSRLLPKGIAMPLVYYSDTASNKALPICVTGGGIDYVCPSASKTSSENSQILITTRGEGIIAFGEEIFEIKQGCGIFIAKGTEYNYRPLGNEWTVDWLEFEYSSAMESEGLFLEKKFAMFSLKDSDAYREKISDICAEIALGRPRMEYAASAKMYSFIMDLCCEMIAVPTFPAKVNPAIDAIIDYINENYMNEISLADLCRAAGGMSEQYLCRLFKHSTGMRPVEYILKKRIDIARSHLEKTDMPISEVVVRSGFNNTSYFYRNFKKFTGKSPLLYRQRAMGIEE